MGNLVLTFNIVLPIFMLMLVGYACKRFGLMNAANVSAMNKLVFKIFLPMSLCKSLMNVEPGTFVNPTVLVFGFVGIIVVALLAFLIIPRLEKENPRRGVMIQGIFRSNYAIFGIPLCEAIFPQGDGGVAAMMVIATIPIFNVLSVISLEVYRGGKANLKKILIGIAKNPLIWGAVAGYLVMQFSIPVPEFLRSTVSKLASVASPLALFALGGSIDLRAFRNNLKSLAISLSGKLVFAPLLMLFIAYAIGLRGPEFAVLMIVFGSPCAVSSYTMAAQMDGDAELAAQQVMLSTILSAITMFVMIFMFKTLGIF